jgi:hypothetical protein
MDRFTRIVHALLAGVGEHRVGVGEEVVARLLAHRHRAALLSGTVVAEQDEEVELAGDDERSQVGHLALLVAVVQGVGDAAEVTDGPFHDGLLEGLGPGETLGDGGPCCRAAVTGQDGGDAAEQGRRVQLVEPRRQVDQLDPGAQVGVPDLQGDAGRPGQQRPYDLGVGGERLGCDLVVLEVAEPVEGVDPLADDTEALVDRLQPVGEGRFGPRAALGHE